MPCNRYRCWEGECAHTETITANICRSSCAYDVSLQGGVGIRPGWTMRSLGRRGHVMLSACLPTRPERQRTPKDANGTHLDRPTGMLSSRQPTTTHRQRNRVRVHLHNNAKPRQSAKKSLGLCALPAEEALGDCHTYALLTDLSIG